MSTHLKELDSRREVVRIMGTSSLPAAATITKIGARATYEISFRKVLTDLPDSTVHRLWKTLESDIGGMNFLRGVEDIAFGQKVGGWLRVNPLPPEAELRLSTLLRYAPSCQHAPASHVLAAAELVQELGQTFSGNDDSVAVSALAAALDYADRNGSAVGPNVESPIIRYALDNQHQIKSIAAIVRERGWDTGLVALIHDTQTALHDGVL
jgi:hypothetical protein